MSAFRFICGVMNGQRTPTCTEDEDRIRTISPTGDTIIRRQGYYVRMKTRFLQNPGGENEKLYS